MVGKQLYRDVCDSKLAWDLKDQDSFLKRRKDWSSMLTETLKMARTVAAYREPIAQFTLHAFGDDSTKGVCGAVYVVVQQAQGTTRQLISAKSRPSMSNTVNWILSEKTEVLFDRFVLFGE